MEVGSVGQKTGYRDFMTNDKVRVRLSVPHAFYIQMSDNSKKDHSRWVICPELVL